MANRGRTRRHRVYRRFRLALCLSIPLLPAVWSAETSAQSVSAADALDEIIVTARRIEENVQDVPMSVQVLSGSLLDEVDATRLYELQFNVPGLVVNVLGMNGAGLRLRGVSLSTHLNGVYIGESTIAIARMFDLERIEVLKGPQGTLYGRNSTGGSLNFITRAPADEFGAEIEVAHGSFDTARIHGHLNIPAGNVAARVAFVRSEGDGYIRNTVDDRVFGEDDYSGLRASLRVQPNDSWRLDLMAQRVTDDGASGELWSPNPAHLPDPGDIHLTTVRLSNPHLLTETDNVNAVITYDAATLGFRSITGFAQSDVRDVDDCAGTPFLRDCIRGVDPSVYRQKSQEFHLFGQAGEAVDWLLGAQYFEFDEARKLFVLIPSRNAAPQNDNNIDWEQSSHAFFAQATVELSHQWSLALGLRKSYQRLRVATVGTGVNDSPTLKSASDDWGDTTWRIDLKFSATDDLMLYGGISTGFESGGIPADLLSNGEFDHYDSEKLMAFEAGIKVQWLDKRATLNAAAFLYDFDDLQVNTVIVTQQQQIFQVDNAAKAEIYGIDAEGLLQLSERWLVSGGVVWLPKREFVEYRNDRTGDTLSGNKLVRAPEWSSSAAIVYRRPLFAIGTLSTRLEYHHRSSYFFSNQNISTERQGDFALVNLFLTYEPDSGPCQVFAAGRNLGDTDYYNQVFLQSSPGYPYTYEAGLTCHF